MRSENSGLIDLDALLKEASAPELPKSADESDSLEAVTTAPASLPEPEPPPPPPAPPPTPTPTLPSVTAPSPTPRPAKPQPVTAPRRKSRLPWVGVTLTIGAIAFLVGFRRPEDRPSASSVAGATLNAPSTESPAPATAPLATGISLDNLPAPASAAPSASASAASPIAITPRARASAPIADPSAKLVAIADEAPPSTGDLGGAMREAVGARNAQEPTNVEPTAGGSARQLRPSPGAVVGAINSVLPEARACLLSDDEPVRAATIVFRSDGTVARVDLGGPSRLNDECIRTALMKARTSPFVDDTFAARATVRP